VIVYLIRVFYETGTQSRFPAGLIQVHGRRLQTGNSQG